MSFRSALCMTAALVLLLPGLGMPVIASQSGTALSEEFVAALLSRFGETTEIIPGQVAEQLDEIGWFPEGSRVLGSIVFNDTTSSAYAIAPGAPAQVDRFVAERFGAAGWRSPERGEQRGFVRSIQIESRIYCEPDGRFAQVTLSEKTDGTLVRITLNTGEHGACNRQAAAPSGLVGAWFTYGSSGNELRQRLPVLTTPAGSALSTGGGSVGSRSAYTMVKLRTDLTVREILSQVRTDLFAAGWEIETEADAIDSATGLWKRDFEDGLRCVGLLSIIRMESGSYEVMFHLVQVSGR